MPKKEYSCKVWRIAPTDRNKSYVSKGITSLAEKGWKPILFSFGIDEHKRDCWFYTFERDVSDTSLIEQLPEEMI
jgi:hypothetical protein